MAFPDSAPAEQTDHVAEQMRAQPNGEQWVEMLGGEGTPDLGQNVALAIAGYERLAADAPHIIEAFTTVYTREDGTEYCPGDDPSLIYHLARYERLLRAGGGEPLPFPVETIRNVTMNSNQRQPTPQQRSNGSIDERHGDITEEIHLALSRGDKRKAARLDAERSRISNAVYGNQPIVGSGGRNAW